MFIIGEALIEDTIAHEQFACNLSECKGACCTLPGGRGAPLAESEKDEIEKAFPFARKYLSQHHLRVIEKEGCVENVSGNFSTTCVDDKDCVFVYYEDGIARCSIERAYQNGETTWRKPLSCHLFPLRITKNGRDELRYERIQQCLPARENGRTSKMPLVDFLKDALIRNYGESWYEEFNRECQRRNGPADE